MGRICLVSPDVGPSIVALSRQKWEWFTARVGRKLWRWGLGSCMLAALGMEVCFTLVSSTGSLQKN
jgi:hypothetical protein